MQKRQRFTTKEAKDMHQTTMEEGLATYDLEKFVDLHGLPNTLDMLGTFAWRKQGHLRTNWEDESAAKDWGRAYMLILRAHDALTKL